MKSILRLTAIVFVLSFCSVAYAQYPAKDTMKKNPPAVQANPISSTQDYVMMENGKMIEYKKGKPMDLTSTFMCTNGDKVSSIGRVTMTDGTTRTLREGDMVYRDGILEAAKARPEVPKTPPK